ncbi:1-phosphatidylinositol 4,5-bisphosphate phosphodiesterase delta-1-like isoform X1 [Dermacentor variabilis]|uniref:1-phosphatidylinositol 4,5-bisphosphate phosphodiesterase delta-1-like isoform X1 n=1 Tax=Dermacentor variabilis TaxID=34621 RepID=UPI003F5B5E39
MDSSCSTPECCDTPTLNAESAAIEDVLQCLSRGMRLYKVRSAKKTYRRCYQLLLESMHLVYRNSRKPSFFARKPYVDIFEVEEVRKGWKTDVFNDVERKYRRGARSRYLPFGGADMSEDRCFSLILSPKHETLDLVARTPNECDLWVRGLRHLVANCKNTRRDQEYVRWLRDQFQKADVNKSGALNFQECQGLLRQLNITMDKRHCRALFNAANFKKHKVSGEDVLDRDEFISFYHSLLSRPDIDAIFKTYAGHSMNVMGPDQLQKFLTQEQKINVSLADCKRIIENYEVDKHKPQGYLGISGFREMLLSEEHDIFDTKHRKVCQDMNQPLNHYYIASSHNTYLVQGQLVGSSSVEGYIRALKKGCRCLELDVWDGPDNDPIVYHGYTLTTKILFRDVLESVKQYAFKESQYPVILSLENHCTLEQQKVMAKHLVEMLGPLLHKKQIDERETTMPPPSALLNKILIKGKKLNKDLSLDQDEDSEDESTAAKLNHKSVLAEELSDCVNYCKATHFKSFEEAEKWHFNEMASFSEVKASKISSTPEGAQSLIRHNSKHLSRIYPKGTRTDSSNYDPVKFWNVGCQIVALNYQSWDQKMFLNEAKFSLNGHCGYVLMPEFLRKGNFRMDSPDPSLKKTLVLRILSGQQLPKPLETTDGEIVDPYVVVKVFGHPSDNQKVKTRFVRNNGFNPTWEEKFELPLHVPELAILVFTVKDESRTGKNMKLAKFAIPLDAVREGYRHVRLCNNAFISLVPASIFVHVSFRKP